MDDVDGMPLDDASLWRTSNPQFGVVRVVVVDGDYAKVLDDLNSDYREVELRAYRREGQGWQEIFSQDDAGFPEIGDTHGGGWCASPSDDGGYGWTFGRALIPRRALRVPSPRGGAVYRPDSRVPQLAET